MKEKIRKQPRESNFELLRIVAMFMIILVHYAGHGGGRLVGLPYDAPLDWPTYFGVWFQKSQAILLNVGGQVGVDVFVMISGYFMSKSKFRLSRTVRVLLWIFFYSVSIALILNGIGWIDLSGVPLKKIVLPVLTTRYWFATAYVVLILVAPWINILIEHMTQRQYLGLLAVTGMMTTVIPSLLMSEYFYSWFIFLYLVAAYIRVYDLPVLKKPWQTFVLYLLIYFGYFFYILHRHMIYDATLEAKDALVDLLCQRHRFAIFVLSVLLFMTFKNLRIPDSRAINAIAGTTFGIYLIHDNEYLRPFVWNTFVHTERAFFDDRYILFALIASVCIFAVCALIDTARLWLFEKPVMFVYGKIERAVVQAYLGRKEKT